MELAQLRNVISHREFIVGEDRVVLRFHPITKDKIEMDFGAVRENSLKTLGLISILLSFRTMFKVHIVARTGDIESKFPFSVRYYSQS